MPLRRTFSVLFAIVCAACAPEAGAPTPGCTDTCEATGSQCGERCGVSCGTCASPSLCDEGRCRCTPRCEGRDCHADDGCGGTCGPCDEDASCVSCALRLVRVEHRLVAGEVSRVTLAIESVGAPGVPAPSLADLRFASDPPMLLERVHLGAPLQEAGKRLHRFTDTNLPFRPLGDGVFQLLVLALGRTEPITPGRLLLLNLTRPPGAQGPEWRQVSFRFLKRDETLAPRDADRALRNGPFDAALVVRGEALQ